MEFILSISIEKFRSTNAAWNDLMLNAPWSVGYVTTLVELTPFEKKEDWEQFYYNSGKKREEKISTLNYDFQKIIEDESLIRIDKNMIESLSWDLKNINTQYGRTKESLMKKAHILYDTIKNNGLNLSVDDCFECVRFRVICETWNGVIVREHRTIETLQHHFPDVEFKKVPGDIDHKYAVDYELYKNGGLYAAIQIKPQSYMWDAPYIQKARKANKWKNQEYFKMYKVLVFDIISNNKGEIQNPEVLRNL
jgi:ferredoxin-like protein FixX